MRIGWAAAVLAAWALPAAAQDAAAGAALFKQRCRMCHVVAPGARATLGPDLAGVAGRRAAAGDYNYSPALKASGLTWDRATLDRFLAAPGKAVPGTRMVVAVPDAAQRAGLVAFLQTLGR